MTQDSAIVELMSCIQSRIAAVHSRTYKGRAPEKDANGKPVKFPYAVWRLPNSTQQELPEELILEVDTWDNKADTTALENLTSEIDGHLHGWNHVTDFYGMRVFRMNRLEVLDPDPAINRRKLRYLVRVYFIN